MSKITLSPISIMITLVLVGLSGLSYAQGRPGEHNPYGSPQDWTIYPDDEAAVITISDDDVFTTKYWIDDEDSSYHDREGNTQENFAVKPFDNDRNRLAVAAGLFYQDDDVVRERVARAFYTEPHKLQLEILTYYKFKVHNATEIIDVGNNKKYCMVGLAAMDLDGEFGDDDDEVNLDHDEIVLVSSHNSITKGRYYIDVDVFDYELNRFCPHFVIQMNLEDSTELISLRVEKGDFDGDDDFDIVVIANHSEGFTIYPISYDREKNELIAQGHKKENFHDIDQLFDVTAGDFDGDGKDDLAVAVNQSLFLYTLDDSMQLTLEQHIENHLEVDILPQGPKGEIVSLKLCAGFLFHDPKWGFDAGRDQIAVVYYEKHVRQMSGGIPIEDYALSAKVSKVYKTDFTIKEVAHSDDLYSSYFRGVSCSSVVTGNFSDKASDEVPMNLMEILISYISSTPLYQHTMILKVDGSSLKQVGSTKNRDLGDGDSVSAAVAYDSDGDSLMLGKPTHVTVEDNISFELIMQDPPKHVDFLPEDSDDWDWIDEDEDGEGNWSVVNVNAYPEFNVDFEDEEQTVVSKTDKNTTTQSIGYGAAVSAQTSFALNAWVFNGAGTVGFEAKISDEYERKQEDIEKNYKTQTQDISMETDNSDVVYGEYELLDIWRYPVRNQKGDDESNVFMDILVPGPFEKFALTSLDLDEYQPAHVNGNLLSYPSTSTEFPQDLGGFGLPDGTTETTVMSKDLLFSSTLNATNHVKWSDVVMNSESTTSSHTLSESLDLFVAYKGSVGIDGVGKTETKARVDINVNNKNNWSKSSISETEISTTKGVTINRPFLPEAEGDWKYEYKPVVYMTKEGVLKAAHAVNFVDNKMGNSWGNYYGGRPDPALALFSRFHFTKKGSGSDYGSWHLKEDNSRMAMRGVILYRSEDNKESGEKVIYPGNSIEAGDKVDIGVRIYNFSLRELTQSFNVKIECVHFSTLEKKEWNEEENSYTEDGGTRREIGSTRVNSFDPREMREISVTWNTSDFIITKPHEVYRLYVTIDPENEVKNEIHEWKDEENIGKPGWTDNEGRLYHGNNEGYYPPSGGYYVGMKPLQSLAGAPQVNLHEESLAIQTEEGLLSSGDIRIPLGETCNLRAHIRFEGEYNTYTHVVMFRDRNPEETNEVISCKRVDSNGPDIYVWTKWQPKETGTYNLSVITLEHSEDTNPIDAFDMLQVTVYDPDSTPVDDWAVR